MPENLSKLSPQSGSFTEAIFQNYFPKPLYKTIASKRLCFKAFQSYFSRRLPKAILQSGSQKLPPKLLSKVARQNCAPLKLPPKVNSESCFPKLLSKATPRSCRSSKQLFINAAAKPQSCSPQLLPKAALHCPYATESRVPKKLPKTPKLLPEATSKLVRKAVQSCSSKLLPGAAPQSCSPKLSLQGCNSGNLLCKAVRKLRPKVATKSCSPKVLSKAIAPQSYSAKRLLKAAPESCY